MFRQLIVFGTLALTAILGVGCSALDTDAEPGKTQSADLLIRSPQGLTIASGTMTLPDPLPASGSFSGTCDLAIIDRQFPSGAVSRSGECQGEADGKQLRFNLNPGVMDNNISLTGDREGSQVSGTCEISTFAGPRPLGTFTLRLQSEPQ